jgi:2-polyprenyl-3-methyl-5-hydroxy-6-metoxy-1,4-benzoquinol methylase
MDADVNGRERYRWLAQECPICQVPPTKRMGRRGGRAHRAHLGVECEIWCCRRCGLIFPNPMPVPVAGFNQHYEVDPEDYFKEHRTADKETSAAGLLAQAEKITGGRGRLLDIGSGRGELLQTAQTLGWNVTGIEPSPSFAKSAELHSGAKIRREPVERCGFADGYFDCVVLAAVLEHLYNPDATIAEVSRILRPGGALFVDVPNERALYFKVGNLYQKLRGRDWVVNLAPTFSPFHVFGFSPHSLRALLSKYHLQPRYLRVYPGRAMVPSRHGIVGELERLAANAVTSLSKLGSLGTYVETWAVKD